MDKKYQKNNKSGRPAHCLVIPFPNHTYTNPMIQFSKRLQDKGVSVTLVLTHSFLNSLHNSSTFPFPFKIISDGHDHGGIRQASSFQTYLARFKQVGSLALTQLLESKKKKKISTVDCIIYAGILPWVQDVAKKFGLVGAAFMIYSCAVNSIYYHAYQGLVKVAVDGRWEVMVEGLPLLEPSDMPSLINHSVFYHNLYDTFVSQFSSKADWIFCNTYNDLEKQVTETMGKELRQFRAIGPHIPSKYLDKRLVFDKEYGIYRNKPGSHSYIKWLKTQPDSSVVYICLGATAKLDSEQLKEVARGIKESNRSFLWSIHELEHEMIPKRFIKESCENGKGMVVTWCPQVEVLAQRSIGCFVTDCWWGSILEAKSLGVPIVAMPLWNDQQFNAKHVTEVWKTGVRVQPDVMGLVRGETIEQCIREVMEGERAGEMKRNAMEWRELARKATDGGGSSDRNIEEFVASLMNK